MELVTVIVIILILASLLLPVGQSMRSRARIVQCTSNLKNLYVATNSYIVDNQQWPQMATQDINTEAYANGWLATLNRYGIEKKNWQCISIQEALYPGGNSDDTEFRLDYIPTQFDPRPKSPYRWPTHPWFIERASVHGRGNLFISADGSVHSLDDLVKRAP